MRRSWIAIGIISLVSAACGSTVGPTALQNEDGSFGAVTEESADGGVDGFVEAGAGPDGGPAGGSGAGGTGPGGTGPGGTGPGGTGPGGGGGGGQGKTPVGRGTKGVTNDVVRLGIWYHDSDQAQTFIGKFGGQATASSGDPASAARVVADHINANGGVAGRKLEIVPHELKVQEEVASPDAAYQAACSTWTEDNEVFAFMASASQGVGCATKSNRIVISDLTTGGTWVSTTSFRQSRGLWYGPTYPLAERRNAALVESLWQRGWFPPDVKVGILYDDKPVHKEGVQKGMLPALARHGITPAAQIAMGQTTDHSTTIVQLRRAGVTHILWASSDTLYFGPQFMLQAATGQQWYPHWAFGSDQQYGLGASRGWPRDQLPKVTGIGWLPLPDTASPKWSGSANAKACTGIMEKTKQSSAQVYCETMFFLQHALNNATEVSNAGMAAAMARMSGYASVQDLDGVVSFAPGRHDGPGAYRAVVHNPSCAQSALDCFTYTGPTVRF